MKLLLAQRPKRRPSQPTGLRFVPGNEVLRLATEIMEGDGDLPSVDVNGACLGHWNGQKIAVVRSDLTDLINRGLLDGDGAWTDFGRRELARHAGNSRLVRMP